MSISRTSEKAHGNYPPPDDTTSEGGYGGNAFAPVNERGLIDQSTGGLPLGNEVQDACQGTDEESRRKFEADKKYASNLNPYGESSLETRHEAEAQLESGMAKANTKTYQDEAC